MDNGKSLRESYYERGIYIDQLTQPQRIQDLISELRPLKCRDELIRVGAQSDGGYLVPNDLDGIESCFSPGVDQIASFEADLLERGIGSHLADFSVSGVPGNISVLSFTKKFLGCSDNEKYMTLSSWVKANSLSSSDLLLQMDIEGGEYDTILATPSEVLQRFRIIVIEIHNIESWGCPAFLGIVEAFFTKLLANHAPVHIHPNNCCGLVDLNGVVAPRVFELTLYRRDRALTNMVATTFPHPLDRPNINRADLVLPSNWYR
jgi:hypothetical protein